ncbi:MAG: Sec-independent protein translocase subunit TatA [Dermabacter sp.]|nr:Sec-independent protein translocase subunit TatA [Dermabacter sp.]
MNFFRQPWVIILLIVLVILLFGANKLPGLARNMGQSMRIFKSEVQEMRKDDPKDEGAVEPRAGEDRQYDPRDDRPAEPVRDADAEERYRRD